MAAETQTLNFGPEWLRTLSSGGSVTSPPPSPALPKYKLADHRYGREEMLALYIKEHKVPEDLMDKEFLPILNEEPLLPLALVPFTEEEQRNFSMSVNSAAVLRLMGRGGGPVVAGAPRGRGVTRGRGRGRGEPGFYQRSFDEVEGGFGRGAREINRSQSWEERGGDRRFEKPGRRDAPVPSVRPVFDEASALLAKKQQHDFTRSDSENWRAMREEANGERWRQSSPDGPRSAGWREPGERPRRRFDFEFRERDEERGGGGAYRRTRSGSGSFDDDNLPEWCLDDEGEMGTFDSSGAFMSFKKGPKEPIPEEQELEFKGADEEDEEADDEGEFRREDAEERQCSRDNKDGEKLLSQDDWDDLSSSKAVSSDVLNSVGISGPGSGKRDGVVGHDHDDDEGLKHLEQEAEKMVASLQDTSLEEDRLDTKNRASALPLTHEAAMKWFYKDPQGDIQGPFTNQEMAEWFQAGYFTMTLLVKRGCDEGFQPLGEVIKMWGRVPFAPGPVPPPFLNDPDHERLKRQQELAIIQMQLQYQQFLQAQLYSRQCAQSIAQLQQKATLAPLTPQQQQHLALLIQHYQTLKQRTQEHQQGLIPAVSRSLSVPESTGSLWELKTPTSQPAGWEGGSIWDLPPESQGPTLEQLQQLEQRCEAELRMRDDDERKRQEEEELLQRQEEERKRREEEEAARRKQQRRQQDLIKTLQQQQQQQQQKPVGWNNVSKAGLSAKSLLEIQQEEARHVQKQQQQQRAQAQAQAQARAQHSSVPINNASVWGNVSPGGSSNPWGSDVSNLWGGAGAGTIQEKKSPNIGFWDDAVKELGPPVRNVNMKTSKSSPSLGESYGIPSRQSKKKTEEEDKLMKLFQGVNKAQDGFTQWCEQMLHALNTSNNLDVPTFVSFLKEVESPYEVHDYITAYLGETPDAKEFAKQFLERRAKQKQNHQRQQQQQLHQQQQESVWGLPQGGGGGSMPSAYQCGHSAAQQASFEAMQASKKKKKQRMVRADPSILGNCFQPFSSYSNALSAKSGLSNSITVNTTLF
ncbi:unnamed protein product [Lampetra planeri]